MADPRRANNSSNPFTSAANSALWSLQTNNGGHFPNSSPAEIPQNIFTNPAFQPSSIVNLSNSSDVVIGPMTQYQGPVTIYQYMDATVESRSMRAEGGINQTKNTSSTNVTQKLNTTSKLIIVLILIVTIISAVVLYLELFKDPKGSTAPPQLFKNDYDHSSLTHLGNGHRFFSRVQWSAQDPKGRSVPLEHPIPYVLITHIGVQMDPCDNFYKCAITMRSTQDSAVAERNLTDINSNFYVGDDGNVYEGRGWDRANAYANNSLAVTFMGDYGRFIPSDRQLDATQTLLDYAVANKFLKLDYKLVAHNQTRSSKSPGVNVYRQIKNWKHFYPCGMKGNPKCGSELGMPAVWDANL